MAGMLDDVKVLDFNKMDRRRFRTCFKSIP